MLRPETITGRGFRKIENTDKKDVQETYALGIENPLLIKKPSTSRFWRVQIGTKWVQLQSVEQLDLVVKLYQQPQR